MKEFAEKLIGRLEENTIYDKQAIGFINKYGRGIGFISKNKAIEIVNQLAEEMGVSKMEDTTWIPCSERLPEENTEVRIKFDNGKEFQGGIDENGWYLGSKDIMFDYFDQICLWEDIKIVAWKHL